MRLETANGTQLDVDELVEGLQKLGTRGEAKALLLGQATLAKSRSDDVRCWHP